MGVIRGHSPTEGAGSLTATRLEAIAGLPDDVARMFLSALQMPVLSEWPRVPAPSDDGAGLAARAGQVVVGELPREPPAFVAREILDRLTEAAGRGRVAVVCALTGMRGVGKTQVAAAYARARVHEGWGLVGWVNAETRDTLLAGLAQVAERVGVADPEGDSLESARRLREHLQTRPRESLMVFDNATDPDGLRPLLPSAGSIQMVVTSTDQAFVEFGAAVEVAEFTRQESLAYLRARTGLDDQIGANAVAHELGDLPLGVAQAAATIRRQHLTYTIYLQRLRQVSVNALLGRVSGGDYPHPTAAALLLSIEAAEADDPTGLLSSLLRALATLSPDGVRRDLLDGLGSGLSGAGAQVLDTAIERCVAQSLLTWSVSGESLVMHRLLGRVLRERDKAAGRWPLTVEVALDMLQPRLFDGAAGRTQRDEVAYLVAQIEALWATGLADLGNQQLIVRSLRARSWAVRQLIAVADLSRAIDIGERVLADHEQILGADHPETIRSRRELADAYMSVGRVAEAGPLYEQALADAERVLGEDHPDTMRSQDGLAEVYESMHESRGQMRLFERTLSNRERVLGDDHPDTMASRNNLAKSYLFHDRLDKAIPLLERNLHDRERFLGPEHPDTLTSMHYLAQAYQINEERIFALNGFMLGEARELHERTLADRERVLGADHPDTISSRIAVARCYRPLEMFDKAIPLFEAALADSERVLGSENPLTDTARLNLAGAYSSTQRFSEAIPLFQDSLAHCERVWGPRHTHTEQSRRRLAKARQWAEQASEAQRDSANEEQL